MCGSAFYELIDFSTRPVGGLFQERPMFRGFTVAFVALISTAQLDQYLTNGRYTDAATDMLRQIGRAFGF
jgi:hypothetical protein